MPMYHTQKSGSNVIVEMWCC